MIKKYSNKLFCFSPPVMLATFIIEAGLLIYTAVRYKLNATTRIIAAMLALLATFQLAEFGICGKNVEDTLIWSRIGYVAITLLPPLGLHLIYKIAKKKLDWIVVVGYATGIAFALLFAFSDKVFASQVCTSNYAIFHLISPYSDMYFIYYYGWLITGLFLSYFLGKLGDNKQRRTLKLQSIGYISFLLPTGVINAINPETMRGIPSIMCGFAVIYALILVLGILPTANRKS